MTTVTTPTAASALRPLNRPRPVRVRVDARHGTPAAVRLDGKTLAVETVREWWRIDDEWWRQAISRLYFEAVLESGARITLYRDLNGGGWYVQR